MASDPICKDANRIIEYIRSNGVTMAFFPPQLARLIIEKGDGLLKVMLTGSDKVSGLYSEKTRIFNVYGASETFGPVTFFEVDKPYPELTPIGKAFDGSRAVLLDGEICISGQIADGYINMPELTADRFVLHEGATFFKTGDMGKMDGDGNLVYIQRKDWMLKVRGFRVEPGEIEAAMKAYVPVSQAVVIGFENAMGETALYGVYTAETHVDSRDVERVIKSVLPDYMIPAFLEQVDDLPLNQNGKIDRVNIPSSPFREKIY